MQVQFLHFAQWVAGVTASLIAGTSIMIPTFTDDSTVKQDEPQKTRKTVVRKLDGNNKIDEGIDELLKKYNIELKDSAGIQQFTIQDDSTRADIIIIDTDELGNSYVKLGDSLRRFHYMFSDSAYHFRMPNVDSLLKQHTFHFRNFDKDFRKNFKNFRMPNMDSLMEKQQFYFRNFEGKMDSAMRHFEFNFRGMDSAFKNMEFEFKTMDSVYHFYEPNETEGKRKPAPLKKSKVKKIKMAQGEPGDKSTNVYFFKNNCGDSLKVCNRRIVINNGEMPALHRLPALERPPKVMLAHPETKNSRVVIIKKKGGKKKGDTNQEPQIAAEEKTEIDRGKYIPGEYTDATPWDFRLSPNPTNGVLNISCKLPSEETTATIGVYDIRGNVVYSRDMISPSEFQNMQINLTGKATGTYLLQIAQGAHSFTRKFEIQQ